MIAINTRDTAGFARFEGALSLFKLLSLAGFIVLAILAVTGVAFVRNPHSLSARFGAAAGQTPGSASLLGALLFAVFAYAGISVVAMAAAETRRPEKTIPRAIPIVSGIIIVLYVASIALLTVLVPAGQAGTQVSPFVQALNRLGHSWAASAMNVVVLAAALSSMNSALYGVTRMLRALAARGDAPRSFARLNPRGVPAIALWVSSVALALTIALAYFLPNSAYVFLSSSTSLVAMFNWGLISLAHLRFRAEYRGNTPFRMWGYPYTSYLALAMAALVAGTSWFIPGQRAGIIGLAFLITLLGLTFRFRQARSMRLSP